MAATIQAIRVANLAELRALQSERERLDQRLRLVSQMESRALRVILCQEQTGRILPLRAPRADELPDAA